jgi:hypothetical protein
MPAERRYQFANVVIGSTVPLPELLPSRAAADWQFAIRRTLAAPAGRWIRQRAINATRWLEVSASSGGHLYHVRFVGGARFRIDFDSRRIDCLPEAGVPRQDVRHLLVNHLMPLVVSRGHGVVLHASAVAVDGVVTGFVGNGGFGKSTLAAALTGRGGRVVTDDCLIVDTRSVRAIATPTYPAVRLWPDSARALFGRVPGRVMSTWSAKRRLPVEPLETSAPIPVGRLFVLADPSRTARASRVMVTPIQGRDAFLALLASTFQLDLRDIGHSGAVLDRLAALVDRVAVYRLSYPRDLSRLDSVIEAIGL